MYQKLSTFALTLATGAVLFSGVSYARDNDDRWNGYSRDNNQGRYERSYDQNDNRRDYRPENNYKVNLTPSQYRNMNRSMQTAYWQKCSVSPHGRYYDCTPTRYSQVNYVVGRPLPRQTVVWDVPYNVRYSLPRPYANTRYVWVDRDILLIDQRDNTVLDIIRAVLN